MKSIEMIRSYKTIIQPLMLIVLVLMLAAAGLAGCSGNKKATAPENNIVRVERGNLFVGVNSDGHLVMPHKVNLSFGTTGVVKELLVKEGDYVGEGTLLARLDNTEQKIEIEKVRYDLQSDLNSLETGCSTGIDYPYRYPDTTALLSFEQAQTELDEAQKFTEQGYYKEAVSKIRACYYDIETSITMLNSQIQDVELFPDLNTTINYATEDPDQVNEDRIYKRTAETMRRLAQDQELLIGVQKLIEAGSYENAVESIKNLKVHFTDTHGAVASSIGQLVRFSITYPDTANSLDFLQSATSSVVEMQKLLISGDYDPVEFAKMLRLAQLDLRIGQDVLENRQWYFESGLNLSDVQKYNLNLQKALTTIENQKQELLKTEILAPFNGMVVEVGVKVDDKLSGVDYSSKTAVKLVDTGKVMFEGIIDEVDIFKLNVGQKAKIVVDAIPDKELTGTVTFVSPYGTKDIGVLTFAVTITLDPSEIALKDNLTATATIAVEDKQNVLLIPVDAVNDTPMGKMALVIDKTTGKGVPRPVKIGAQNYDFAEILSGLEEGDQIIVVPKEVKNIPVNGPMMGPPPGGGPPPR